MSVPGEKSFAGKIVTNMGRGLRIELRGPIGGSTPTQVDQLGEDCEIKQKPDHEWVSFWVRSLDQCNTRQLRETWLRCRRAAAPQDERLQSA
jgi:hypothetical protein